MIFHYEGVPEGRPFFFRTGVYSLRVTERRSRGRELSLRFYTDSDNDIHSYLHKPAKTTETYQMHHVTPPTSDKEANAGGPR